MLKYLIVNLIVAVPFLLYLMTRKKKPEKEEPKKEQPKTPLCKDCKHCSVLCKMDDGNYVGKCSKDGIPEIQHVKEIVVCAGFERKPYIGGEGGSGGTWNHGVEPIVYYHGDKYYHQCTSKYRDVNGITSLTLHYVEENLPLPNQEHWVDENRRKYSFNPKELR